MRACTALTTIDLGTGVVTISDYAFQKCAELTEITFPDATETIGQNAFAGCVKLAKVSFGKNMKTINAYSLHRHELHGRRMSPAG